MTFILVLEYNVFNYQGKFAIFHNSIILIIFILAAFFTIKVAMNPPKPIEYTVDPFFYQKLLISHFEHLKQDTIPKIVKKKKKGHL